MSPRNLPLLQDAGTRPFLPVLREERVGSFNRAFVVELGDGARVEAVFYRDDALCVSSQVGCAVRCPFCASGANGLARGLTLEELIGQVEAMRARGLAPTKVTVSGVGEPLHNAEVVRAFLGWCRAQRIAPSLTTSGGPLPRLREALVEWPHNGLTLSVHAGREATRARLVPKAPTLEALFATIGAVVPALTRTRRKKTALAYLLIDGENDADEELNAFAARAAGLGLFVHLYALNPVPTSEARSAPRAKYEAAFERLRAAGLTVRMSSQARVEAQGGCGTLVAAQRPT
jgi:23S rRNA (adenine2503-C2)-methyltransferase